MPMGITSTQFVSYRDIRVEDADLIEDAFGINHEFNDVISLLRVTCFEAGEELTTRLIGRLRQNDM
jgi:hypothetical protein